MKQFRRKTVKRTGTGKAMEGYVLYGSRGEVESCQSRAHGFMHIKTKFRLLKDHVSFFKAGRRAVGKKLFHLKK